MSRGFIIINVDKNLIMNLERYQQDGLELYIDKVSGESYASQSSLARMCNISETAIRKWLSTSNLDAIKVAKTPTTQGFRTSNLLNEDTILLAFEKYNKDLFIQCAKAGVRVFLHKLAGYEVISSAQNNEPIFQRMISPGTVEDTVTGIELLFNKMNITSEYLPSVLAEAVKERHPDLKEIAETMKIKMALNSTNDIENQSFIVTEIGEMLNPKLSAVKVNKLLHGMGYQEKINKRWVLTEEGKENGGVVIATTKKNLKDNVEQIRWKEEVVDRINEFLES